MASDLEARIATLEKVIAALIDTLKAGAGGMHLAGAHPLDAVLAMLRPPQAP